MPTPVFFISRAAGVGCVGYAAYIGYKDYLDSQTDLPFDLTLPPVPLPKSNKEILALENRRVTLRGRFDHEKELLIGPRKNLQTGNAMIPYWSSDGYYVVTPFVLSNSGRRLLVNRGWISFMRKEPVRRSHGQIEDEVEFNAYVVPQEPLDLVTETRISITAEKWVYEGNKVFADINLTRMAGLLNIDPVALFIADKESTIKGGPVGGQIYLKHDEYRYIKSGFFAVLAFALFKMRF